MTGVSTNIDFQLHDGEILHLNQPPFVPGYYYVMSGNAYGPYTEYGTAEGAMVHAQHKKELECVYF